MNRAEIVKTKEEIDYHRKCLLKLKDKLQEQYSINRGVSVGSYVTYGSRPEIFTVVSHDRGTINLESTTGGYMRVIKGNWAKLNEVTKK